MIFNVDKRVGTGLNAHYNSKPELWSFLVLLSKLGIGETLHSSIFRRAYRI